MAILQLEISHRKAKTKTKIEKKQPSLSRELEKGETQSTDGGSIFPNASLFAKILILQKQALSSFPSWDSPSLQACSFPFSHRCKDGQEVF